MGFFGADVGVPDRYDRLRAGRLAREPVGLVVDSGTDIAYERRVNIIPQMLTNGFNTAAAAFFVKCSCRTAQRWWKRWCTTGSVDLLKTCRGPLNL